MAETLSRMLIRSTAPATEPLSLEDARIFLRVDGDDEDTLITDMIAAVREAAEEYLCRSLITQQWTLRYENYAPSRLLLPKGPVQMVDAVTVINRHGDASLVEPGLYHLAPGADELHFESTVMGHAVEIAYTAGYGDAEDVPASIRQGMLVHLAVVYEDRLGASELPSASVTLYKPHRAVRL